MASAIHITCIYMQAEARCLPIADSSTTVNTKIRRKSQFFRDRFHAQQTTLFGTRRKTSCDAWAARAQ